MPIRILSNFALVVIDTVTMSADNGTVPSSFILDIFSNLSATKANKKKLKPPKIYVDIGKFLK